MKLSCIMLLMSWAVLSAAQDVHVSEVKGGVNISITAQQGYEIMAGEKKRALLTIQCSQNQKGTKSSHLVMFSAEEDVAEDNPMTTPRNGQISLTTQMGDGAHQPTEWIPYGNSVTYAYYGKTEPERVKFLQQLLASPSFTVEFTPFLTGTPHKAVFDIGKLRDEVKLHPECAVKTPTP